jgi:hypothetical protein
VEWYKEARSGLTEQSYVDPGTIGPALSDHFYPYLHEEFFDFSSNAKTIRIFGVRLALRSNARKITISNVRMRELHLSTHQSIRQHLSVHAPIRIQNSWIDHLTISPWLTNLKLEIDSTHIGEIDFLSGNVGSYSMTKGGLVSVGCPPPYEANPFRGPMILQNVKIRRQDGLYKGRMRGSQPWKNVAAHLADLGSLQSAGVFHSVTLSIERKYEKGPLLDRAISWCYEKFGDYGNSIARPAIWLFGLCVCLLVVYSLFDVASPSNGAVRANWTEQLFSHRLLRNGWLALQPILNPFGAIVSTSPPVEPSNIIWYALHALYRLASLFLIFLMFLGIRRRFRLWSS